jgi:hypothetical protein
MKFISHFLSNKSFPIKGLIILVYVLPFVLFIFTPMLVNGVMNLTSKSGVAGVEVSRQDSIKIAALHQKLAKCEPAGSYLVINTITNTFKLINKRTLVHEGFCSTGSNTKLVKDESQSWMFKTPKGIFRVQNKITNPLWKKPDWYFIESGLPVPPPNHESRFEYGVLGDYALNLGNGYLIHGTLYQRFLGLPVTHGCVRMGDADLEMVFKTMPVGSRVYIF